MELSKDSNTAYWMAYVPLAMMLIISIVAIVWITANISSTDSGDDERQGQTDTVLLIRDYPVFSQTTVNTAANTELTIAQATKQAWAWVKTGVNSGQAQYYGYARGVLDPWWNKNQVSSEFRILRATILQQQHQFSEALNELDQVIEQEPLNVQAHFTRSAIHLATGNLQAALQDCRAVWLQADAVSVAICISQIKTLQGKSTQMTQLLTGLLQDNELSELQRRELHTSLAELYWAQGNTEFAKKHFAFALLLSPQHGYVVAQYSMLLLQEKKYSALAALLELQPASLDNRIKLYAAQRQLAQTDHTRLRNTIDEEIADILTASTNTIAKSYAKTLSLYYLFVEPNPASAVYFAQLNWQQQKGISDALLLLQATTQAEDQTAAALVYQWIDSQDIKDQRLAQFGEPKNG